MGEQYFGGQSHFEQPDAAIFGQQAEAELLQDPQIAGAAEPDAPNHQEEEAAQLRYLAWLNRQIKSMFDNSPEFARWYVGQILRLGRGQPEPDPRRITLDVRHQPPADAGQEAVDDNEADEDSGLLLPEDPELKIPPEDAVPVVDEELYELDEHGQLVFGGDFEGDDNHGRPVEEYLPEYVDKSDRQPTVLPPHGNTNLSWQRRKSGPGWYPDYDVHLWAKPARRLAKIVGPLLLVGLAIGGVKLYHPFGIGAGSPEPVAAGVPQPGTQENNDSQNGQSRAAPGNKYRSIQCNPRPGRLEWVCGKWVVEASAKSSTVNVQPPNIRGFTRIPLAHAVKYGDSSVIINDTVGGSDVTSVTIWVKR
ncbi:MAG TPA: hypothetical protein VLG47_07410 [Candidatus Saccharimonadales bacterium]|nr:hypothetical protein [Candidatus Saccharimonadales bacterium]